MKLHYKEVSGTILDIKPCKRNECFNWGSDNAFPSLIEALIGMSVTSKTCSDRVAKAIYGASFGEAGKVIVNSKGQSLNEVLRIAARWYSKQNNAFLQIGYDEDFDRTSLVCVPVPSVRVGKADDNGYSGKFLVYDNWDKQKSKMIKPKSFQEYNRYNPDKKVVESQVKLVEGIENYNGQILHIKKDETYVYALPDLSPVLSETLLEANSQTFRSQGADEGFLNTKLLTVAPFKDDDARKAFKKVIDSLKGAKNTGSVFLLETAQATDDVSKQLSLDDLSGTYNDDLLSYSDKQAEKNICKAYTVPLVLIDTTDSSSLGDSGGKLEEAKNQLWESREEDRHQLEEAFSGIMKGFDEERKIEEDLVIKNPYIDEDEAKDAKNINKKAQANLRGSVGGVTALTSLIEKVNTGVVSKESAVSVIKGVYGYTESKAKEMVGGFEEEE